MSLKFIVLTSFSTTDKFRDFQADIIQFDHCDDLSSS